MFLMLPFSWNRQIIYWVVCYSWALIYHILVLRVERVAKPMLSILPESSFNINVSHYQSIAHSRETKKKTIDSEREVRKKLINFVFEALFAYLIHSASYFSHFRSIISSKLNADKIFTIYFEIPCLRLHSWFDQKQNYQCFTSADLNKFSD